MYGEIAAHPLDARNDREGKENPPVFPMGRFATVAEVKEVTEVAKVKGEKIPFMKGGGGMGNRDAAIAVGLAVVVGFGVSLAIEWLQAYLPSRDSSLRDLICNTIGTMYEQSGSGLHIDIWKEKRVCLVYLVYSEKSLFSRSVSSVERRRSV